jgi:hypothetical protein
MGKKKKKFDWEQFQDETVEVIAEALKRIPKKWRATAANFIATQAIISGARNTYEGIGIAEAVKVDYINICQEVAKQEAMCQECKEKVGIEIKEEAQQAESQAK